MPKARKIEKKAGRGSDQYMIRLPDGMRDAIAKRADGNDRSMNAEIISAIRKHLDGANRFDELEAFIEKHREEIGWVYQMANDIEELQRKVNEIEFTLSGGDPNPDK